MGVTERTIFFLVFISVLLPFAVLLAYGHGIGYETLPPQMLGSRSVAMEVSSTIDNATNSKEIKFLMFDTNTGLTVKDASYHITAIKGNQVLFEGTYKTSSGVLLLSLIPDDADKISVVERKESSVFGFLLGRENPHVEASGSIFDENGLYRFTIDVLSAEHYSSERDGPVRFESGLSFPEPITYNLNDIMGHEIQVLSYYDVVDGLVYDAQTRTISFAMPFEWTQNNINQTMHIHEEIFIPKTLTELQVSDYSLAVNGFEMPDGSLTIDDYQNEHRIIHILLYQTDLNKLYEGNTGEYEMRIALSASSDEILLVDITDNVQYRLELTTNPQEIHRGSDVSFRFKIYDVFLQGRSVSVDYDLSIKSDGDTIFRTSGKSNDSRDVWDEITLTVPHDATKIITLHFENLGGNGFAKSEMPLMLSEQTANTVLVPEWIKRNASWWCQKSITDDDFLRGIEYLIGSGMIQVDAKSKTGESALIPDWIRNNSCLWASNSITDEDFVNGIAYLVKNGIIVV